MSTYREFYAKTVDQAIEEACRFFNAKRDALEINIVSGGSGGIFGLGARKACVQARRSSVPAVNVPAEENNAAELASAEDFIPETDSEPNFDEEEDESIQTSSLSSEECAQLREFIQTVMHKLLLPMSGEISLSIDVEADPILVHVTDEEYSGLIIGRDGQTIAALQYLTNRIVSKSWPQCPRIQLDAGDYRQKQQEQLQGMALFLSKKAKKSGRVQSTRPLSSYHRRIVHMALQDDLEVQTRSKGDGPLKRVLIFPPKHKQNKARKHQAGIRASQS